MIAYIHSYTPNINHRQRSEDERGANRQPGSWWRARGGAGGAREAFKKAREKIKKRVYFFPCVEAVGAGGGGRAGRSLARNFDAKHGSAATCQRQQGLLSSGAK